MHRISYTSEELLNLQKRLFKHERLIYLGSSPSSIISSIIYSTYDDGAWGYTWMSGFDLPYRQKSLRKKEPETVYRIIAYQLNTLGHTRKSLQHAYQTMYHLPYTELPLQINHKNLAVRTITAWRLELGK